MVGPQLRSETEPWVRLPTEPPAEEADVGIIGMVFPEVPFQMRPHQRVLRHAAFAQCLDCGK
eukprot:904365-Amphidinium_carterae.1